MTKTTGKATRPIKLHAGNRDHTPRYDASGGLFHSYQQCDGTWTPGGPLSCTECHDADGWPINRPGKPVGWSMLSCAPEPKRVADKLRAMEDTANAAARPTDTGQRLADPPATVPQINFLVALGEPRNVAETLTKRAASARIEELKSEPRAASPGPQKAKERPADGVYYTDTDGTIIIYKVKTSGQGNAYAVQLDRDGSWVYCGQRPFASLVPLDLDTARQFGQLYGMCGVCGRTLTDETSIAAGIGPVCAGKLS